MKIFSLLLLAAVLLTAQTPPPAAAETLSQRIRQEQQVKKSLEQRMNRLVVGIQGAKMLKTTEEQLEAYLKSRQEIRALRDELENATRRQIELYAALQKVQTADTELPQATQFAEEDRTTLQNLGIFQKRMYANLKELDGKVQKAMRSLPPPNSFTTEEGIPMLLVGRGKDAFYVTQSPIAGGTGISQKQAVALAQKWTEREKTTYRLPTVQELRMFTEKLQAPIPTPVWTSEIWKAPDYVKQQKIDRFQVIFFHVWDPQNLLGKTAPRSDSFGEMPHIAEPQICTYLVTGIAAGRRIQWNKVQEKINR